MGHVEARAQTLERDAREFAGILQGSKRLVQALDLGEPQYAACERFEQRLNGRGKLLRDQVLEIERRGVRQLLHEGSRGGDWSVTGA